MSVIKTYWYTFVHYNMNQLKVGDNALLNKVYKFRLYPNQNQKELINKIFGSTKLVNNYY